MLVFLSAFAIMIERRGSKLRLRQALIGSLAIKIQRLTDIFRLPDAIIGHVTFDVLSTHQTRLSRFRKPVGRVNQIRWRAPAVVIHHTQIILRDG
jgi:hypothetical protein